MAVLQGMIVCPCWKGYLPLYATPTRRGIYSTTLLRRCVMISSQRAFHRMSWPFRVYAVLPLRCGWYDLRLGRLGNKSRTVVRSRSRRCSLYDDFMSLLRSYKIPSTRERRLGCRWRVLGSKRPRVATRRLQNAGHPWPRGHHAITIYNRR